MKIVPIILAALVNLLSVVLPAQADTPAPIKLTFGVAPQQAVTSVAEAWTPLLAYLSNKTGYALEFRTAQDILTFDRRIKTGEFDFAYFNPLLYTIYSRASGYRAVAKEKDTQLVGIVVVPKDSGYKSLKDLKGVTMAFPSPMAFAATILPQLSLKQMGVEVVPRYVSSHESVYRTVALGLYPAGGGIVKTYDAVDPAVHDQLRILWKSAPYTSHPIAVHARVPQQVSQRVVAALLAMAGDPKGAELLAAAGYKGFVAAKDSDYDDIRKLEGSINHSGLDRKER